MLGRTHIYYIWTAFILALAGCTSADVPAHLPTATATAVSRSMSGTGSETARCAVTAGREAPIYQESTPGAGSVSGVDGQVLALARSNDGWLGIDPGSTQAGSPGRELLRWYRTEGLSLTFDPAGCENSLPVVLSMQSLQNSTYHFEEFEPHDVTLIDGFYTNPNFDDRHTGDEVHDTFLGDSFAFGDLNGDGSEDALVVLNTNTGGSGTFVEMWPVLNVGGSPKPGGRIHVGDRSSVETLVIQRGVVTTTVIVPGPGDAMCCPSHRETWTLKLVDGVFVKQ